ncbi:DUF3551 domain-containing protein [Afipia sp. DC4300-2b1]|uniref:DUF3551 domain-containing protein n=1 Tax=Afipia sp. DC4300-2b1 TaxID=2804672 RepID=UPI003CE6EED2
MLKIDFASGFAMAVVAVLAIMPGSAAHARGDAPFCSENFGRTGMGRVCDYYTYEQCQAATSGVGGSCHVNAWYQPRQYYDPAPRRYRKPRHKHRH